MKHINTYEGFLTDEGKPIKPKYNAGDIVVAKLRECNGRYYNIYMNVGVGNIIDVILRIKNFHFRLEDIVYDCIKYDEESGQVIHVEEKDILKKITKEEADTILDAEKYNL